MRLDPVTRWALSLFVLALYIAAFPGFFASFGDGVASFSVVVVVVPALLLGIPLGLLFVGLSAVTTPLLYVLHGIPIDADNQSLLATIFYNGVNLFCALAVGYLIRSRESLRKALRERDEANVRLTEQAALQSRLLEAESALGVGVVVARGQKIAYANDAFRAIVDHAETDLASLDWPNAFAPATSLEKLRTAFARSPEGVSAIEVELKQRDGILVPVEASFRLSRDHGETEIIAIARDVSARIATQCELDAYHEQAASSEKLRALGTLTAGVAHEINNPLTFMLINAEIADEVLKGHAGSAEPTLLTRDDVNRLLRANRRVLEGIRHLAQITKSLKCVAHGSTSERSAVDVNSVVDDVLTVAHSRFDNLSITKERGARRLALASPPEVSQVLLNLVFNAADALQGREMGTLKVATRDEGDRVVVEVRDNGPEIPAHVQSRLFEPFFTTKASGTGLGLSVSKRIVEDHGGRLTFTSKEGNGTTFRVELPAVGTQGTACT